MDATNTTNTTTMPESPTTYVEVEEGAVTDNNNSNSNQTIFLIMKRLLPYANTLFCLVILANYFVTSNRRYNDRGKNDDYFTYVRASSFPFFLALLAVSFGTVTLGSILFHLSIHSNNSIVNVDDNNNYSNNKIDFKNPLMTFCGCIVSLVGYCSYATLDFYDQTYHFIYNYNHKFNGSDNNHATLYTPFPIVGLNLLLACLLAIPTVYILASQVQPQFPMSWLAAVLKFFTIVCHAVSVAVVVYGWILGQNSTSSNFDGVANETAHWKQSLLNSFAIFNYLVSMACIAYMLRQDTTTPSATATAVNEPLTTTITTPTGTTITATAAGKAMAKKHFAVAMAFVTGIVAFWAHVKGSTFRDWSANYKNDSYDNQNYNNSAIFMHVAESVGLLALALPLVFLWWTNILETEQRLQEQNTFMFGNTGELDGNDQNSNNSNNNIQTDYQNMASSSSRYVLARTENCPWWKSTASLELLVLVANGIWYHLAKMNLYHSTNDFETMPENDTFYLHSSIAVFLSIYFHRQSNEYACFAHFIMLWSLAAFVFYTTRGLWILEPNYIVISILFAAPHVMYFYARKVYQGSSLI